MDISAMLRRAGVDVNVKRPVTTPTPSGGADVTWNDLGTARAQIVPRNPRVTYDTPVTADESTAKQVLTAYFMPDSLSDGSSITRGDVITDPQGRRMLVLSTETPSKPIYVSASVVWTQVGG